MVKFSRRHFYRRTFRRKNGDIVITPVRPAGWPSIRPSVRLSVMAYSGDCVFLVHGNACETLINDLETQRLDHA